MHEINYINKDTQNEIDNYLAIHHPPGLILAGIPGLGKTEVARYAACQLLHCNVEQLSNNPDFFETKADRALKVEDIEQILSISHRSSVGNRKVFILHHADTITRTTQNRLLKILEDQGEKNILILLTDHFSLFPTIMSRCFMIHFHPLEHLKMNRFLQAHGIEEKYWDFLSYLLDHAPYQVIRNRELLTDYMKLYEKLKALTMRQDLFILLHALVEKDAKAFFDNHPEHPEWNIRLILFPFYQMFLYSIDMDTGYPHNLYTIEEAYKILEKGQEHLHMLQGNYTKNDYFNLLRFIVQVK